jgi:ABC-type dipeptide/oligopeptide/nickel transport system ATPase subunit
VPDPTRALDEEKLVNDAINRWEQVERQRMQQWQGEWMSDLFTRPAMTSLRDVEAPVEFSGGNRAQRIIERILD